MIYQRWKGKIKVAYESEKFTKLNGDHVIEDVNKWFPKKPADPAALKSVATDTLKSAKVFPNMLHVGGGISRVNVFLTFSGDVEYWEGD